MEGAGSHVFACKIAFYEGLCIWFYVFGCAYLRGLTVDVLSGVGVF